MLDVNPPPPWSTQPLTCPLPAHHSIQHQLPIPVLNACVPCDCSISENQSLALMPPWYNKLLLLAMASSMALHFVILEVDFLAVSRGGEHGNGGLDAAAAHGT